MYEIQLEVETLRPWACEQVWERFHRAEASSSSTLPCQEVTGQETVRLEHGL